MSSFLANKRSKAGYLNKAVLKFGICVPRGEFIISLETFVISFRENLMKMFVCLCVYLTDSHVEFRCF